MREALSLAIDREAIVERIMGGSAAAAANLLAYPGFGASEKLKDPAKPDPERAKELLAEAGYPNGFSLTLGSPAGRYTNDQRIAQTVAAMWARVGVKAEVETSAPPVFFKQRDQYAFSSYLAGWAVSSGEMINPLKSLVMSKSAADGYGTTNWSHYSNKALDDMIIEASSTLDEQKRAQILEKAGETVINDYGILPLQFELSVWAMKKGIHYEGRADQLP